jgi:superfamily II DNA or RNA helicase
MHFEAGATIVGFTATPLGLGDLYDTLIVAGTPSELRACGALVWADHFGPDEPDLRHVKKLRIGEDLSENEQRAVMGAADSLQIQQLFGRVVHSFEELNPERKPSILFAPGVPESIWFAREFARAGIKAAHIDGENIWVDGELYRTSRDLRRQVLDDLKCGRIAILCNRFVLREGVDAPWLAHGIFATVFGSLQSYLQAGGRLLRACPGLKTVTIQDHGGNWHRHGDLNADRIWKLEYTGSIVSRLREDRLRTKKCRQCGAPLGLGFQCMKCGANNEREPIRCPECSRIINGFKCKCGCEIRPGYHSRPVVQVDGSLMELRGDIYLPRRISRQPDAVKRWKRCYYRAKNSDMTFAQAEALYAKENGWCYPPRNLPLMPQNELDWFRRVKDVPRERLIPEAPRAAEVLTPSLWSN